MRKWEAMKSSIGKGKYIVKKKETKEVTEVAKKQKKL